MTWQTCLRFVTWRRPLVLATAPDRAEASRQGGPMHDRTCLEVLQLLLCKFTTRARLPLDGFVPRERTVGLRESVLQQDKTRCRHASEPVYGMFARGRIREIRRRVR